MSSPGGAYERAIAAFQGARLSEAEALLREALARSPDSVEALQLLGTVLSAQGRAAEGLQWLDRARAARPTPAIMHNRAQALFQLGRHADARAELEEALALNANLHPSWNLLGAVRSALGDLPGAEQAYMRALELKPDHPETRFNFALLLHGTGRRGEAIEGYRRALALRPAFIAARERLADALNEEGVARYGNKRFGEAIDLYKQALELRPDLDEARNNLGGALAAIGRHDEAIACEREVLEHRPEHADAHSNLGFSLHALGRIAEAKAQFERALAIRPDHSDALSNLGFLLQEEGRLDAAIATFRRALEADPQSAIAGYNLGFALLCRFEFSPGWELSELRYRTTPPMTAPRQFAQPEFGADDWGKGHRIAIWGEQGVGDRLIYATLLAEVAARGENFVLETDARLIPAFARSRPDWKVVTRDESPAEFAACDRHIAAASLPKLLRLSIADFDRQPRALLAADPARAAAYRARLASPGARLAGISWRSFQPGGRSTVQRKKSASLDAYMALSRRDDLKLLDLQYGDTAAEREGFARAGGRLERFDDLDLFNDIDGVLAAIAACDIVVTTSNVTAHFAGVLGKKVLLVYLCAIAPFHYWATDATGRCLWYPSMRIVTGRDLDTWPKVFGRIEELLDE